MAFLQVAFLIERVGAVGEASPLVGTGRAQLRTSWAPLQTCRFLWDSWSDDMTLEHQLLSRSRLEDCGWVPRPKSGRRQDAWGWGQ